MARKTSDIAMLLGSRSKSRSRGGSGFGKKVVGFVDSLLGRQSRSRSSGRKAGSQSVSAWVFGVGLLVAFGGGFIVGDRFGGGAPEDGKGALQANGHEPAFFRPVSTEPLTGRAFVVAVYGGLEEEAAYEQAAALCGFLRDRGLERSRPYQWPTTSGGSIWVAAVYVDGTADEQATRMKLQALPDPDDRWFAMVKNQAGAEWPVAKTL